MRNHLIGKWRRSALFAALVCVLPLGSSLASAQGKATGAFMNQAFVRVTNMAAVADKLGRYGYADGVSIVGGWVDAGRHLTFGMPLKRGVEYMFLAAGDNDAQDVDLHILDARGNVLRQDTKVDAEAIVPFVPPADGAYTLKLTLFKARNNFPCVCVMAALKKNGWSVALKSLDEAGQQLVGGLTVADEAERRRTGKRVDLRRAPNQWAFYGGVVRQGNHVSVLRMDLGNGPRIFLGVGDRSCHDADLVLLDNTGRVVQADRGAQKEAIIGYEARGGLFELRVENARSARPSLMMMAVYDIR